MLINACFSVANGVFQLAVLSRRITTFGRVASIVGLARKMSVSSPTGSTNWPSAPAEAPSAHALAREMSRLRRFMTFSRDQQAVGTKTDTGHGGGVLSTFTATPWRM